MVLADTLTHLLLFHGEDTGLNAVMDHMTIGPGRKTFQDDTQCNPVLHELICTIKDGWPDNIDELPIPPHMYWKHHDMLTVKN